MTTYWNIVRKLALFLLLAVTVVIMYAIGFRMTEQYMERLDRRKTDRLEA